MPRREAIVAFFPGALAHVGPRLVAAFVEAAHTPPIRIAPNRPSGALAQAILDGELADVYVSANVAWMRRLQAAGKVRRWHDLAGNRLCLVVRPGTRVARLEELATRGLTVVAPQAATDPCGQYVEMLWRREGLLASMRQKQARGELLRSNGSGDLPAFLRDGRAAAGMLYYSEGIQLAPAVATTIELPPAQDLHEAIRFTVAALTDAGRPFVRFLLGPDGQRLLAEAGFLPGLQRGARA